MGSPVQVRLSPPIIGDVAQLGECLRRMQEVDGSIPFISTKSASACECYFLLSLFLKIGFKHFQRKCLNPVFMIGK